VKDGAALCVLGMTPDHYSVLSQPLKIGLHGCGLFEFE